MKSTEELLTEYRATLRVSAEAAFVAKDAHAKAAEASRAASVAQHAHQQVASLLMERLREEAGVEVDPIGFGWSLWPTAAVATVDHADA